MRVLIAEDDPISRRVAEITLARWNIEVIVTTNGQETLAAFQNDDPVQLALIDWMMPFLDGIDVIRQVRRMELRPRPYLILLTARGSKENVADGLDAGADDYIVKPFNREELRARLQAGRRIVELQLKLEENITSLQESLDHVRKLQGLLPICCYCKKIRSDNNYWHQLESYFSRHSEVRFSHGICPDCMKTVIEPQIEDSRRKHEG